MKSRVIVYITDNNYIFPTLVSISSLLHNATSKIIVNIVSVDVSKENKEIIKNYQNRKISINIIDVKNTFLNLGENHFYVSKASLFKFMLPEIFPNLNEILYIDSDVILNKGFEKIFNFDIKNYYAAVVQDMIAVIQDGWHTRLNHTKYFNSGVMYLNLKKMRQHAITKKLIEYKRNDITTTFMDQNALNAIIGDNCIYISPDYNFLNTYLDKYTKYEISDFHKIDCNEIDKISKSPLFFHFAGSLKPWKSTLASKFEYWYSYVNSSAKTIKNDYNINKLNTMFFKNTINEVEKKYEKLEIQFKSSLEKIEALYNELLYVKQHTVWGGRFN